MIKICRRTGCGLPTETLQRNYCCVEHRHEQQKADQRAYRAKMQKEKRVIIRKCKLTRCENTFEVHSAKQYCSEECKAEATNRPDKIDHTRGSSKRMQKIPDYFLRRGLISNSSSRSRMDNA